jgi:carotenoid cleavage dioxygenase
MNRKTHEIKWFHTDAFYVFHFLNAYEENGSVIVDFCKMARLDMSGNEFGAPPLPFRFTLDMKSGGLRASQFDEYVTEFPRLDERLAGFKHRYGYYGAGEPNALGAGFDMLVKRDYQTGRTEIHNLGKGTHPGEPVFVPRSEKSAEDDGYVLAVFYDEKENRSELVIIDARNFAGKPLARLNVQHRVPYGFHGNWVARSLA